MLCRSLRFLGPIATIHDTCTNGSNGPCDIGITLCASISQDMVERKGVRRTLYFSWERDACEVKFRLLCGMCESLCNGDKKL